MNGLDEKLLSEDDNVNGSVRSGWWAGNNVKPKQPRVKVSTRAKLLLGLVLGETLLLVVDQLLVQTIVDGHDSLDDEWFMGLMAISTVFMVYFSYNAVFNENLWQLYAFLAATMLVTLRVIFQYVWQTLLLDNVFADRNEMAVPLLTIFLVLQIVYFILVHFISKKFGWKFYKTWGADCELRRIVERYQQFESLLALNMELSLLIIYTGIVYLWWNSLKSILFGCSVLVVEMIWQYLGYFAIRKEYKFESRVFQASSLVVPAYVCFLVYALRNSEDISGSIIVIKISVLGVLTIITRVAVIGMSFMVVRNFGQGLKERVFENQTRQTLSNFLEPRILALPESPLNSVANGYSLQ